MKYYIASALALTSLAISTISSAQTSTAPAPTSQACESRMSIEIGSGEFVKKRYSIDGQWSLNRDCTQQSLSFDENFRTKGGPDLKVYLSKLPLTELKSKTVDSNSLKLSVLKANKGEQTYVLPEDVDLSDYKSVVIHCEAFSVLWGGFDLP